MKIYSVTLSKAAEGTTERNSYKLNAEKHIYEVVGKIYCRTFCSLTEAKRFIKDNINTYLESSVTKVYSNGKWVNCGEIKLSGSNKHFIANSNMTKANY